MDEDLIKGLGLDDEETVGEIASEVESEEETIGNIKISVEVVSKIAVIAASEIDGVSCMHKTFVSKMAEKFGGDKASSQGVKVDITENTASIDLYLVVDYGVKIPELAWNVQERVKESVENMTGLEVTAVNIHIEGISFDNDDAETVE